MIRYMYVDSLDRHKFLLDAEKNHVPVDGLKVFQTLNRNIAEGLQQEVPEIFSNALSSEDSRSLHSFSALRQIPLVCITCEEPYKAIQALMHFC